MDQTNPYEAPEHQPDPEPWLPRLPSFRIAFFILVGCVEAWLIVKYPWLGIVLITIAALVQIIATPIQMPPR